MADHAREKALSDPQFAPLRDGDPPREVQQLIAEMRQEDWSAHTTHPASVEAVVNRWADELSALLTAAGSSAPPQEKVNDGNPYVFCDTPRCIRGAGHNGDHVLALMANDSTRLLAPIALSPGSDRSLTTET
jgi:hypothetical protein